jgi:uncharacterized protein YndB with AHSA1/START domain
MNSGKFKIDQWFSYLNSFWKSRLINLEKHIYKNNPLKNSKMTNQITIEPEIKTDFRAPKVSKKLPRAVADAANGIIVAVADLAGSPEAAFRALTTNEVEQWWKYSGFYNQKEWKSEVRVGGAWSVTVELVNGGLVHAWGEFCELHFPSKIVMTRRFDSHPFLGERETTISYRFEPITAGTRVIVRDEGFIGRSEAAYGNAEIWEHVLGWLDAYLERKSSASN